jgi:glycosyltransferase involved in cell wall biosynthesis
MTTTDRPRRRGVLLYITNTGDYFLSHRLTLAQAAMAQGWEVHVCMPPGESEDQIRAAGLVIHSVPLTRRMQGPIGELRAILGLIGVIRQLRPDLIHCIAMKSSLYGVLAGRFASRAPMVSTIAGLGHLFVEGSFRKRVLLWIFCRAAGMIFSPKRLHIIFQNTDDQALFEQRGIFPSSASSVILGSGVDLTEYAATPAPDDQLLIIHASRMLWSKGVGDFVAAARRLHDRLPQARFALVGGVDDANPDFVPRETLESWSDEKCVEWWGHRSDMVDVLSQASIVVLPTYYREGVPKILIEAASMSRPIVTTNTPGCRDIVNDGVNGFLVAPRDVDALAHAIEELANDRGLRIAMGAAGRKLVSEKFELGIVLGRTTAIYDRLAADRQNTKSGTTSVG